MPSWLQSNASISESESITEVAPEQETPSFSLSPMDVSLGDTSSRITLSQISSDQQVPEDIVSEVSETPEITTSAKPRKPRRKSKVQLQDEQGES